ncbi:MAG TPA: TetR/AcrR family transcriptional regulator [Burkholderiales bacterium]
MNKKARTVLEAARTVFLAHGFSAATTDMIQQQAGVSKSTVYAHYANKEALFLAVMEAECTGFMNHMRTVEYRPGALRETLSDLARTYLEIALAPSSLALFRVITAEAPRFPELARSFYLTGPRMVQGMLARQLERAAQAGEVELSTIGVDAAASLFANLARAEAHLQCLFHPDARPSAAQIDQWVDIAVTTFLRAYGRKEGPAPAGLAA